MQDVEACVQELGSHIRAHLDSASLDRARMVVAISGAPGAGKSTLAGTLCAKLNAEGPGLAEVMPMDGYHFDNALLDRRGLRARKGSPPTFDTDALARDLALVRAAQRPVILPVFDRELDLSRAGAREVASEVRVILVEGNYLLLDTGPWRDLAPLFDLTVYLDVPEAELERRLVRRWLDHGLGASEARARALGNDIPNARLVCRTSRAADIVLRQGHEAAAP